MYDDTTKFTIDCEMKTRWAPHFISMLKKMQELGSIGSSRQVSLFSDGDGDFRPKFDFSISVESVDPVQRSKVTPHINYDAG